MRLRGTMASFFSPTFLNDFLGLMLRYDFSAAQTRVNTELKYHHSHALPSKEVDNSVSSLLHILSDFAAVSREQYAQSRVAVASRLRTVGLRKWHFESPPLVALGQVPDSRRVELERDDLSHSMYSALSTADAVAVLNAGPAGSFRGTVSAAQNVSLSLINTVLSEEFRTHAATFDEYGKSMGAEYTYLPDALGTDFSDPSKSSTAQSVFTSQPFSGSRRSNSPVIVATPGSTSDEREKHTLSALLLDIAFLLNMRSQVMRVYDCLASPAFCNLDNSLMKVALKELSALTANIVRMLEASLQSDVLTLMTEHDKFECKILNHLLCAMCSLLDWNCVPALLSLYTVRQLQQSWKKLYAGLISEPADSVVWTENRPLTFLSTWAQNAAVKASFLFRNASLQCLSAARQQASLASTGVPFIFPLGTNIPRPSSFLPGFSNTAKNEPESGINGEFVDVSAELNKLVELAGSVVSVAILLNSTPDIPFNSAGYVCWAHEDAREIPSGLESWFPLLDAPKGSFDRKFVIDLSMLFYQVRSDLELCRPCTTKVASVTDLALDVVIQKVSPSEELYVVVLINPLRPVPSHVRAKNAEAYRKNLVSAVQQFTDSMCAILSLRHVFSLLRGPQSK